MRIKTQINKLGRDSKKQKGFINPPIYRGSTIIFDNYKQLKTNEDLPKQIAAELGLDVAKLVEDMNDKSLIDLIDWEYSQLTSLRNAYPETDQYAAGVRLAVPKFFINGREPLSRSLDAFSAMIEEELKK